MLVHLSRKKLLAPAAVALLMAFISSKFLFNGSAMNLIPWGLLALTWGIIANGKSEAWKFGAVYGFTLSFSFLWIDKSGHISVSQFFLLLIIISLLGLFGAACGATLSVLMNMLAKRRSTSK